MKIKIAERLSPFSHVPGAACLVPGTCFAIEAFPTLLRIADREVPLELTGPVAGFTLQQDLEKHCVFVFGRAKEGYYRLRIEASDSGFEIKVEKGPLKDVSISAEIPFVPKAPFERLSLGNHKAQDWDQVQRRSDLKELLPILFCLGQKIPLIPPQPLKGTARLLEFPEERDALELALGSFFKAAFTKMLVPRLIDDQHQGIAPVDKGPLGNRCFLVQEGAKQIRALFFRQNERRLSFLPNLPISFDSGRIVGLKVEGVGEIDFEWSKKRLRRVIIRALTSGDLILELQKGIQTFRVGKRRRQKKGEPLLLEAKKIYYLDRFE